jgi:hypothetical protein
MSDALHTAILETTIYEVGNLVAIGFTAGIMSGTIVFFASWIMASAMNIFKKTVD